MGSVARACVKTKPKEQTLDASQPQTRRQHVNNAIQITEDCRGVAECESSSATIMGPLVAATGSQNITYLMTAFKCLNFKNISINLYLKPEDM